MTIAGSTLLAEMAGDYVPALVLGVAFQYFAIAPMRGLGVRKGVVAAIEADFPVNAWSVRLDIKQCPLVDGLTATEPGSFAVMLVPQRAVFCGFRAPSCAVISS